MPEGFTTILLSACMVTLVILALSPFAENLGLIDRPNNIKQHEKPTAVIGGLAVYTATLACLLVVDHPEKLNFMLLGLTSLVILGLIDDIFRLSARLRLAVQSGAILVMIFGGEVWIATLGAHDGFDFDLGISGYALTVFLGVYFVNAFNMSDGIDGLAAMYALSCLGLIVFGQITFTEFRQIPWILGLASALLIFTLFNMGLFPKYKTFLGDAGSVPIGYVLFWLLIDFSQGGDSPSMHPIAALWCITIPLFDATTVVFGRMKQGKSPLIGDREHLHHIFQKLGLGDFSISMILAIANLILGLIGILVTKHAGMIEALMLYLFTFTLYFAAYQLAKRKTYKVRFINN
jgi:UDP-GlcNAc:undecaprenyl-phosphate GlcNAc-1-phosphate transferase